MSVYTSVDRAALSAWLAHFDCGALVEHVGIAAGMQNTNYFVTTTHGRFVLTLFEHLTPHELDFYLALQAHLAARSLPCPLPQLDREGRYWRDLCGKPAALLTALPGTSLEQVTPAHCAAMGDMLARLHLAAADFPNLLPHPCGPDWRRRLGTALLPKLDPADRALLAEELAHEAALDCSALPRGIIHADLFRDNVLWGADGEPTGVLDFYFAGEDILLFDLAVVVNDWCQDEASRLALCRAYAACRPLTDQEAAVWPAMQRIAALRFWLLRLSVRHAPRVGEMVTIKDPQVFRQLIEQLRLAPQALPR